MVGFRGFLDFTQNANSLAGPPTRILPGGTSFGPLAVNAFSKKVLDLFKVFENLDKYSIRWVQQVRAYC